MTEENRPGFEGGLILPYKGVWPKIGKDVFIAPTATVIGDVEIGDESTVLYGCIIRGDVNWIRIGNYTNLQDGTIVHVNKDGETPTIGDRVSVGPSVMLHGCELQDECMIGMRAMIMDGAVVESGALVAGGAMVTPRTVVKSGELWGGAPARLMRPLKESEVAYIKQIPHNYHEIGQQYLSEGIGIPELVA